MRVTFTPGAVLEVPVEEGRRAFAVMLRRSPFIAFYSDAVVFDDHGVAGEPPMFVTLVEKAAYSTGRWGKPIRRLPDAAIPELPTFFWQSVVNKFDCKIVKPGVSRVTAKPGDCIGLEPEAISSEEHVESRISDTYAGRPNIFVESMKVKL